jgi:hypothetical protein
MNFHTRAVICCDFLFSSCAVMLSHLFCFLSEVAAHSDNNKMVPGEWGCAEQRIRDGCASLPQSVRLCVQMQLTHLFAVCACLSSLPQLAHFFFLFFCAQTTLQSVRYESAQTRLCQLRSARKGRWRMSECARVHVPLLICVCVCGRLCVLVFVWPQTVFAPNLIRPKVETAQTMMADMAASISVIATCIANYRDIFNA